MIAQATVTDKNMQFVLQHYCKTTYGKAVCCAFNNKHNDRAAPEELNLKTKSSLKKELLNLTKKKEICNIDLTLSYRKRNLTYLELCKVHLAENSVVFPNNYK